jgi:hypothetical protein
MGDGAGTDRFGVIAPLAPCPGEDGGDFMIREIGKGWHLPIERSPWPAGENRLDGGGRISGEEHRISGQGWVVASDALAIKSMAGLTANVDPPAEQRIVRGQGSVVSDGIRMVGEAVGNRQDTADHGQPDAGNRDREVRLGHTQSSKRVKKPFSSLVVAVSGRHPSTG